MPKLREDTEDNLFAMPDENGNVEENRITSDDLTPTGRKRRKGFYVPLTDLGTIDEKRFKDADKEKFYAVASSSQAESTTSQFKMDREQIPIIYDALAIGIQQAGKVFMKWPADFTQYLVYSKEQKEQLKEPTARVIDKFAPAWLLKHQEIIMFAMVFGNVTKEMVENAATQYAINHQAEIRAAYENQQAAAKTNGAAVSVSQ